MKFGDNLKRLRKSNNISQEQLSEKVGVSRQSVSKWETSEAYPEMNNILQLCKIFHCNIGDLVNDNMVDIDSLDEEVKMSVVKLKEEKQKKMKVLSKILYLVGKIGSIVTRVGLGFLIAVMVFLPIVLSQVEVKDNDLVVKGNVIEMTDIDDGVRVTVAGNDHIILSDISASSINKLKDGYYKFGKVPFIIILELGLAFVFAFLIFLVKVLKNLSLLFKNIHEGSTPFTLDNVNYIKKMSYFMIVAIIMSSCYGTIFYSLFNENNSIDFNLFNVVEIIFLYALAYIFEYGYEIQKDSKGVLYGKEE